MFGWRMKEAMALAGLCLVQQVHKRRRNIVAICLIALLLYYIIIYYTIPSTIPPNPLQGEGENVTLRSGKNREIELVWREGPCRIPKLDLFDESIRHLIRIENEIDCTTANNHPEMFGSDMNSHLIVLQDPMIFGYKDCCYTPFYRKTDKNETYAHSCFNLNGNSTRIPTEYEFIAIYCSNTAGYSYSITGLFRWMFNIRTLVDMFSFIHEDSPKNIKMTRSPAEADPLAPNIVILGIDSSSHTNFIRSMQRSYQYLTKNLSAIEMQSYSSFAEQTNPNLLPVLTGLSKEEIISTCWLADTSYFDDCNFIWKSFASKGYITGYAEDDTEMGIFLYEKNGFKYQPTDYYLIPLANAFYNKNLLHGGNGSSVKEEYGAYTVCHGPRLGFKMVLNNIKEMAIAMKKTNNNYFQFTWASSLCHQRPNYAGAGDKFLFELLHWFKVEQRLESTIFILMSDHGHKFGELRHTEYGKIDTKMPFLYFLFPLWFSKKYNLAVENVRSNVNKLTTPFDVHETLKDLLDLKSIENIRITNRQANLQKNVPTSRIPRGISLFLSIPDLTQRKCQEAKIALHSCFCSVPLPLSVKKPEVGLAAQSAMNFINQQLIPYPQCAILVLDQVISAHMIYGSSTEDTPNPNNGNTTTAFNKSNLSSANNQGSLIILVRFSTLPSNAIFEATMVEMANTTNTEWNISGQISRINIYGKQSRCVSVSTIKPFCYCD